MAKSNSRRLETIHCYCATCWRKGAYLFEWQDLENKTMGELRDMCNKIHGQNCKTPDMRLSNAKKT